MKKKDSKVKGKNKKKGIGTKINIGLKLFYLIAPFLGLVLGYLYVKNKDQLKPRFEKHSIYNKYEPNDKELIETIELKLKEDNKLINDWLEKKVREKLKEKEGQTLNTEKK